MALKVALITNYVHVTEPIESNLCPVQRGILINLVSNNPETLAVPVDVRSTRVVSVRGLCTPAMLES